MTGSLQIKNGKFYAVIRFKDSNNKPKQKWISTGYDVKNNKRKAEQKLQDILFELENSGEEAAPEAEPSAVTDEAYQPNPPAISAALFYGSMSRSG